MSNPQNFVLTLIAERDRRNLTRELIDIVCSEVKANKTDWLAPELACDIFFSECEPFADGKQKLETLLRGLRVDFVVQPMISRRKKALFADMDSTIIGQECIDELAEAVGIATEVAALTEKAMNGELPFAAALRDRVKLLKDTPLTTVFDVLRKRITLNAGAKTLIATMKRAGAYTVLLSGGFSIFTDAVAQAAGFDACFANELIHDGKQLRGLVKEPILGSEEKRQHLVEQCQRLAIAPIETLAVGDGANDILMLQQAGLGVAFHAKSKVVEATSAQIAFSDLTALLYVQGYREDQFITR